MNKDVKDVSVFDDTEKFEELVAKFDIQEVVTRHRNLSNPLFLVCRRLERSLQQEQRLMKVLPLLNRFFSYFENCEVVESAFKDLMQKASKDYDDFIDTSALLVFTVIGKYREFYD